MGLAALAALVVLALAACTAAPDPGGGAGAPGPGVDGDVGAGGPDASAPAEPGTAGPDDDADPTAVPEEEAPAPADSPLAFTAVDLGGSTVDVAGLAGEPVVLWFWAPWCTICRGEAPDVAAVAGELSGDVTFLGVAGRGPVADMLGFVDDTGVDGFVHLADLDGTLWQRFGVSYQPAYAFVAPDGTVDVVVGALGEAGLAERAGALVG